MKIKNQRDFWAGMMFLVTGVAFAWGATAYHFGSSARPGPAYFPFGLGVLLALLGAGLALHNALSLAVLLLPVALALGYRMRVEEQVLIEALGEEYRSYCRRTRRLVPGLY
jgi:hypothetical protein